MTLHPAEVASLSVLPPSPKAPLQKLQELPILEVATTRETDLQQCVLGTHLYFHVSIYESHRKYLWSGHGENTAPRVLLNVWLWQWPPYVPRIVLYYTEMIDSQ